MCQTDKKKKNYHVELGVSLLLVVIAIYFGSWGLLCHYVDSADRGVFGDQFGAVNALFSGLAFAGLIYTIFLQHDELCCQRQELADNRKEMKCQTDEFKKENESLRIQRFENTFYNMLALQQQIVDSLIYQDVKKIIAKETSTAPDTILVSKENLIQREIKGRDVFRFAFTESIHDPKRNQYVGLADAMSREGMQAYVNYYTCSYFDHYFRHFYTILKFIKQQDWLEWSEQYHYASRLRATLSRYELVWLFYNGLSENGCEKLKPLMEEFSILKNIRPDLLTLCRENILLLESHKIDINELVNAGFSGTDYEFFMTDSDEARQDRYHVKAFYSDRQIEEGKRYYRRWKERLWAENGLCPVLEN